MDISSSANKARRNLKKYMAYFPIFTKICSTLLFPVACLDFLSLSSHLIVVLRRSGCLLAFPLFSQWYKEKGDWREEIAGAGEVERACVCLCRVIYPACKEGVVSVNEVNFSVCNSQATLRLWRKRPHLPSLYCEPLDLIQLLACLSWNFITFI